MASRPASWTTPPHRPARLPIPARASACELQRGRARRGRTRATASAGWPSGHAPAHAPGCLPSAVPASSQRERQVSISDQQLSASLPVEGSQELPADNQSPCMHAHAADCTVLVKTALLHAAMSSQLPFCALYASFCIESPEPVQHVSVRNSGHLRRDRHMCWTMPARLPQHLCRHPSGAQRALVLCRLRHWPHVLLCVQASWRRHR